MIRRHRSAVPSARRAARRARADTAGRAPTERGLAERAAARIRRGARRAVVAIAALLLAAAPTAAQVPAPADVLGFELGTPYRLADVEQLYDYFERLAERSDRVRLERIGETTLGRPMYVAYISSAANLADLDRWKAINRRLARAEGVDAAEARRLAREGKAAFWIDGGLHSTEVAHSQHMPELAHWLATGEDEEARRIRENVVVLLNPLVNPDGHAIVVDWYRRVKGTPFETVEPPVLYHHYVGHDNNRDWYAFTQRETRNVARVFYHEWYPQIIYNHHQTGPFPGRIWVPPAIDPLNPYLDPLMVGSFKHMGQYMLKRFMKEGKPGVSTQIGYRVVWASGFMTAAPQLHNMLGIFTETALYEYATPHCYGPEEVGDTFTRGIRLPTDRPSMKYPIPWPGGCWGVRDAMDYMMTASKAALDLAGRQKEEFLHDIWHMGTRQIEEGRRAEQGPFAWVVDLSAQHDPSSATQLLRILRTAGIEIRQADRSFRAGGAEYPAGSYVIGPQAFRPFVLDMMEPKEHANRLEWPDGPPERPYDITGYSLPLQMGVDVARVREPFELPARVADVIEPPAGEIDPRGAAYLLSHAPNGAATAVNALLADGADVSWTTAALDAAGRSWPAGTFVVTGADRGTLAELAGELGLELVALDAAPDVPAERLRRPRVALYQSWLAPMPEGWTRFVLDTHGFDVTPIHDETLRTGELEAFDVVVLPDQTAEAILKGHERNTMPAEYTGGVGAEGAAALKRFVERGGWVVAMHQSAEFAADQLGLPVRNPVAGVPDRSFYAPGSLLRLSVDPADPLAYGMAEDAIATTWRHAVALELIPAAKEENSAEGEQALEQDGTVYVRWAEEDVLADGWAIGADRHLAGTPAAIRVPLGRGQVVLLAFRPDTRAQPTNTFKLLFNPLFAASIERTGEAATDGS